jgi:hypothetical protein
LCGICAIGEDQLPLVVMLALLGGCARGHRIPP